MGVPGAKGDPGDAGPPGPAGPRGEFSDGGALDGQYLVDGSITRAKLARESVLPEHRGRSNSVRSFATVLSLSNSGEASLFTVPAGRTYVVTDIVAFTQDRSNPGLVTILGGADGGTPRAYVPPIAWQQVSSSFALAGSTPSLHFAAGIRFDGDETVVAKVSPGTISAWVTVSGYEY